MAQRPWQGIIGAGYSKDQFIAYVNGVTLGAWKPIRVILHNTAAPTKAQWPSTPGEKRMKNLESYYRDTKRWSAGPHLFIAPDKIWVFTPLTVYGVHSPSYNETSWGVEVVGDYSTELLTTDTYTNLIVALGALHWKAMIDPEFLRLHKEDPRTTHRTCPGNNLANKKTAIIADVKKLIDSWNMLLAADTQDHLPDRDVHFPS